MSERRPQSSKLRRLNTTDQSIKESKEMNCKLAYQLQKSNIELHQAEFDRTKEIIKYFNKFKSNLEGWQRKWSNFYTSKQTEITEYQRIWHIFDESVLSVGAYIEDITDRIQSLENVRETLHDLDRYENFESQIKQARERLDTLETKHKLLQKDNKNLEKQKREAEKSVPQRSLICIPREKEPIDFPQRQLSIDSKMKNMLTSMDKEKAAFCQKQTELYKEFKKAEIKRWKMLQNQSHTLVKALGDENDELNKLLKSYSAAEDLDQWDCNIFRPDSKNTEHSQSPDSKTVE